MAQTRGPPYHEPTDAPQRHSTHQKDINMKKTYPSNGLFELMPLPYDIEALAPTIGPETLRFHHGKHLQTYVNNLNALLPGSDMEGKTLEDIVCESSGGLFNNAGQTLNHNLYFSQFRAPREENAPIGRLSTAIDQQFGGFDLFREEFEKKGATLFGSGWVWLAIDEKGMLHISQEENAGNPITRGLTPLLTFDVWEHAYYLDYQNRRPAYLSALWQIVNWEEIENRAFGE